MTSFLLDIERRSDILEKEGVILYDLFSGISGLNEMERRELIMATIATHNGSAAHRDHNIRSEKVVSKEEHIDLQGEHEIWHDEKPREAYKRLFGDSVRAYNANQPRKDRKIKDYFTEVCKDAKKHPVYEMIIGVYPAEGEEITRQEQKAILKEFTDNWRERNPNLELIGAYYHADEQGEPHVHLDYVPVAHGYSRGMETQTGLVKALGEMGFEKNGRITAQIAWEARENAMLDAICREHGIEVSHPRQENAQHIETQTYKVTKHLESQLNKAVVLDRDLERKEERVDALEGRIERLKGQIKEEKDLQKEIAGKGLFGRPRSKVEIPYEEYRTLQATAREIKSLKKERAELEKENAELERKAQSIEPNYEKAYLFRKEADERLARIKETEKNLAKAIDTRASELAHKKVEEILNGTPSRKEERMEKFMREIRFPDGKSVFDKFQQREAKIRERANDHFLSR